MSFLQARICPTISLLILTQIDAFIIKKARETRKVVGNISADYIFDENEKSDSRRTL